MDKADFTILIVHGDLLTIENIAHILKKNMECNPAYLVPFNIITISIGKDKTELSVEIDGFESWTEMDDFANQFPDTRIEIYQENWRDSTVYIREYEHGNIVKSYLQRWKDVPVPSIGYWRQKQRPIGMDDTKIWERKGKRYILCQPIIWLYQ
jgi:hypothetical protein